MARPVQIAFLGCGFITGVHSRNLQALGGDIVRRYRHVIVPEMNLGQLCRLIRSEYLVDAKSITKVQGAPFTALELEQAYADVLGLTVGRPA